MDRAPTFRAAASLIGCLLGVHGLTTLATATEPDIPIPVASPQGGVFATNVLVSIASGATNTTQQIRFTLDGTDPQTDSPLYTNSFVLTNSCLLQARSFATNRTTSELLSESYFVLETNLTEFTSSLPLIVLSTFGRAVDSTNRPAMMRVIAPGTNGMVSIQGAAQFHGRAAVKTRGYTSLRHPKKSMSVETRDADDSDRNVSLLGMPKDSDWVLYAPYPDKTMMRDVLAYELSNKMGHYASRTRFVEVFLHDTTNRLGREHYVGVYVLEEKVKRGEHRVDVSKLTPNDNAEPAISGGYIFKKDHLDEVERKAAALAAAALTEDFTGINLISTNLARKLAGRPGYPTGPGGFPADPAGFSPAFIEPPETNFITLTNVAQFTNVAFFTNSAAVATVAATTNIVETHTFSWTTNIIPITNITYLTNVLVSTNVAALTNVTALTNRAVIANVPPFTGEAVFTNLVSFTNYAAFTNVAHATNIAALTNITYRTNVLTIASIVARTNSVPFTNRSFIPHVVAFTNVVAVTNLTVAAIVLNPIPPSPVPPKLPPLLTRLVVSEQGFITGHTNSFYFVEPKAERITPEQRTWLSNYVDRLETALYGPEFRDPTNGYRAYLDTDSFIDHHLIVEITKNIDGYRFSTFFQKDRGGKIRMQPIWDWNLSLGNARGREGYLPQNWYWPQLDDRQYSWFRRLFEDPDFAQRYVDRWAELRATVFVTSNLMARVDQLAAELREPAARNFQRWPIIGLQASTEYFVGKTWAEDLDYLKGWISNRLAWVSAQFLAPPALAVTEAALATGAPLTFNAGTGRIIFTTDGTDPRQSGGGTAPTARVCEQPVTLTGNVNLFARVQLGNRWSSPLRVQFAVRPPVAAGGS